MEPPSPGRPSPPALPSGKVNQPLPRAVAERYWELDVTRGLAIAMMIAYHAAWHAADANGSRSLVLSGAWLWFQRATGGLFLFLVGIGLAISYSREKRKGTPESGVIRAFAKRGVLLFAMGIALTVGATMLRLGRLDFGILHLIGAAIALSYPFIRWWTLAPLIGTLIISVGFLLESHRFDTWALVWMGMRPHGYDCLDYYPVAPWYGFVLWGIFLGNAAYPRGQRRWAIRREAPMAVLKPFALLGRYSLVVYVIHLPIILAVLLAAGIISM